MFFKAKGKRLGLALAGFMAVGTLLGGCGSDGNRAGSGVAVKAMTVLQQDTPLSSEYAGQVQGFDEVRILPRVSGTIVEKFCTGGQFVREGDPLYRIDSRQYESAVLSAQATLAQSEATLNNARIDLQRDEELLASAAIAEQTVTTQRARVHEYEAMVAANAALLKRAQENFDDTTVYAPLNGRLDVNDVAVGTYANAGQTVLVTVGSVDPVYVQFSISETQYLAFLRLHELNSGSMENATVTITLSNGREYPITGNLVQASGMSSRMEEDVPRWPPASLPSTTMAVAPSRCDIFANLTDDTIGTIGVPDSLPRPNMSRENPAPATLSPTRFLFPSVPFSRFWIRPSLSSWAPITNRRPATWN